MALVQWRWRRWSSGGENFSSSHLEQFGWLDMGLGKVLDTRSRKGI